MTTQEFSIEFDTLYNNILSNQAPALNSYEKSIFLTKAQNELILNFFNPKGNKYQEGFDESKKRQIDFSELISTTNVTVSTKTGFDPRGLVFTLPDKVLLILNETFIADTKSFQVVPITPAEYTRLMSKPYQGPLKRQVWRFLQDGATAGIPKVEIIPHYGTITTSSYSVRYIRRPLPIIIEDLSIEYDNVTIDGLATVSECELNPIVHRQIVNRAVELAKVAYDEDSAKSTIEVNTRDE